MAAYSIPDGTKVSMAGHELVFGDTIFRPTDCTEYIDDLDSLRRRMDEDGFLLIRGFYDRNSILGARQEILNHLSEQGLLDPTHSVEKGIIGTGNRSVVLPNKVVRRLHDYLSVVDSDRIMSFFARYLGGPVITLDHKWPRAVSQGASTGAHYDVVYMGAGTKNLYTVWTPLDDVSLDMGPLAFCPGSHKLDKLKRTYGTADAHQDLTEGWLSQNPLELINELGVQWASTEFLAGDIVIFGMFFLHGSLDNVSNRYRFSSDNRYQLANEPIDLRHMGPNPDQIPKAANRRTMKEMRAEWGI